MKKITPFSINPGWKILLVDLGINYAEVLKKAELPADLFSRKDASLTTAEYLKFWKSLEFIANDPLFPLKAICKLSTEMFDPPIFAALCSPNLNTALKRISQFKPLIGPMTLNIELNDEGTHIMIKFLERDVALPKSLVAMELGFFVQIARMATREIIIPKRVIAPCEFPHTPEYAEYFGVTPEFGESLSLHFAANDANKPFVTENIGMWDFFEADLKKRLSAIQAEDSMKERVKAVLLEMLPSGETTVDTLAKRLNLSRRTLQRRLLDEHTNFKDILTETRESLARHYVTKSDLPYIQISFLLGYEDPNSFFRAFQTWTGSTPDTMRNQSLH